MIWGMMELPWQGHLMPKKPAAAVHAVVGFFMMYQMLIVIQFDGVVEFLGLVKVWEDVRRFDAPIIEHK